MKKDKGMSRFKMGMIAALMVLALCLFAGCSAETLMSAGEKLGSLSSTGFGKGGEKYVDAATASVEGFIEGYETLIDWDGWDGSRTVDPEGQEHISGMIKIKDENREKYSALLWNTVKNILDAKASSASDTALRAALNTPYKDYDGVKKPYSAKAIGWYGYKDMKSVINGVTLGAGLLSMVIPAGYDITKVYAYNVPMPVQGLEMDLLIVKASESVMKDVFKSDIFTLFQFITKIKEESGGGEESKIKLQDLAYIPERIANYVGDRTEPSVGDKIAICLLYDVIDTGTKALVKYVDTHPEEKGSDKFDDLDINWILSNCGENLDRAISDIEAIAYIYDFNLDVAGLVGKVLGD